MRNRHASSSPFLSPITLRCFFSDASCGVSFLASHTKQQNTPRFVSQLMRHLAFLDLLLHQIVGPGRLDQRLRSQHLLEVPVRQLEINPNRQFHFLLRFRQQARLDADALLFFALRSVLSPLLLLLLSLNNDPNRHLFGQHERKRLWRRQLVSLDEHRVFDDSTRERERRNAHSLVMQLSRLTFS